MSSCENLKKFGKNLLRKKEVPKNPLASDLLRCLGLGDLTFLSLGAMIGVGIYVTMGQITREAGPSIVLSYFFAGVVSVLSALCYAELCSRIPIAGSSYQFTYMTMGEFWGFFVGWNIALEHAIGVAAISRAVSGYIDSLFDDVMRKYLTAHTPMPGGFLATYPDFFAAGYSLIIVALVAFGVKLSSRTNMFFVVMNLIICGFIIISAMIFGNGSNWVDADRGGFFPHGFSSTLSGAATLIFAYIGYEVIGAVAEETTNPRRNLPLALIISIFLVMLVYMSVASSYVSIVPWYEASVSAPFAKAYERNGWLWAKYLLTVGIVVAATSANIAATVAIPRYLFSLARDGLLMECFAIVNSHTQVPVYATMLGGSWCVLLVLLFGLKELIEFMSIGQLIACTFVAMCVIKLRYKPFQQSTASYETFDLGVRQKSDEESLREINEATSLVRGSSTELKLQSESTSTCLEKSGVLRSDIRNCKFGEAFLSWTERYQPGNVPVSAMFIGTAFTAAALGMFLFGYSLLATWWYIVIASIFSIMALLCIIFMMMFVQDPTITTYKIPLAPISPFLSIIINIALMFKLHVETWVRLGVWMAIGLILYFVYGFWYSKARKMTIQKNYENFSNNSGASNDQHVTPRTDETSD